LGQNNEPLEANMPIDRRKFLNFAAANAVVTALHPLDAKQSRKQRLPKARLYSLFSKLTSSHSNLSLAILLL
jgi:hypothetical protein